MGAWAPDSKSHVAHMAAGDFYGSEKSATLANAGSLKITFHGNDGSTAVLKEKTAVKAGEIVDAAVMSRKALAAFIGEQIADAKAQGVLFSLHLKATMMKVSDPIMFGVVVEEFYKDVLAKHADAIKQAGFDANNGIGDLVARLPSLPEATRAAIEADLKAEYAQRPALAMVNSDKGITNLHVPSDVIVDASMPAMIRDSGKMWNAEGKLQDTKAVIRTAATPACTRPSSTTARRTVPSIRHHGFGAERRPDGAEGRSTARTTRPSRSPPMAWSRSPTMLAPWCSSMPSKPVTSGACARPRTRRSRTG